MSFFYFKNTTHEIGTKGQKTNLFAKYSLIQIIDSVKEKGGGAMREYSADEITTGIKAQNSEILIHVYGKCLPTATNYIKKNNGNKDDALDIFQEAIIFLYRKIQDDNFTLSNFEAYTFSVCKKMWWNELKKRKNSALDFVDHLEDQITPTPLELEQTDRYKLYQKYYQLLHPDCQKILRLFLKKVPLEEIAIIMGYKSEKYAKKKKYLCKQELMQNIKSDTQFKELAK